MAAVDSPASRPILEISRSNDGRKSLAASLNQSPSTPKRKWKLRSAFSVYSAVELLYLS